MTPGRDLRGHIAPLYAFVSSRMGNDRAAAEDVVQETLVAALDRRSDAAPDDLRSWLISVALNKIVDVQRRRRTAGEHARGVAHELASRMIREPLPDDRVQDRETRAVVNEALARLPAETALLLVRKYVEGAAVAEIAAERGMSEKAIESQLTRARSALHEVIQALASGSQEDGR